MSFNGDNYLKSLKTAMGISTKGMAAALDRTEEEYRKLENGELDNVTLKDLRLLVENLEVNPLELITLIS
jgi:transcriptional regulator with XRE-family HTH domain